MAIDTTQDIQAWVRQRAEQDDRLYDHHGQPLEAEHKGEFVAISDDGQIILGPDHVSVAAQALARFGSGTFALRRIGADAEWAWRRRL